MDYSDGKIYCIKSNQTNKVYYGSTIKPLDIRFYGHKRQYKLYLNGKFGYMTSFDILQYDDAYIELIEEYPCKNKKQLERREGEIIKFNENCVNKRIEGRTQKEWREINKDKICENNKEYYEKNKEKMNKYNKEYYEKNKDKINEKIYCECGGKYVYRNKAEHFKTKKHLKFIEQNLCEIK